MPSQYLLDRDPHDAQQYELNKYINQKTSKQARKQASKRFFPFQFHSCHLS